MTARKKEPGFEEALDQLEEITRQLEGGQLTLDESIQAFERGMELRKLCLEMLQKAEKKLEYLERQADGALARKPIDSPEDAARSAVSQSRLFQE
ncbi:MAG: exodeoxyribonuclease VII small subunit [Leptospirales bacterium]|nr:exodeoxyribonuclease VII small subunit [Leptospirales bacterium]